MKRTISSLWVLALVCFSCQGQVDKKAKKQDATPNQAIEKPKVEIKVNKKYDKNGNLIAYDSTYTSFYADRKGIKFYWIVCFVILSALSTSSFQL